MSGSKIIFKILKEVGKAHDRSVRENARQEKALAREELRVEKRNESDRKKREREYNQELRNLSALRNAADKKSKAVQKKLDRDFIKRRKATERTHINAEKRKIAELKQEIIKHKEIINQQRHKAKLAFEKRCEQRTILCQKYIDQVIS